MYITSLADIYPLEIIFMFELLCFATAILSSAIAAVAGFGIGSLMTPILHLKMELKLAVALVSIPHFIATSTGFWRLRHKLNKQVLLSFGITSAAGGLCGALLNAQFTNPILTIVFSVLLIFAGLTGATGLSEKLRFGRRLAWLAGFLSGLFGGLVGNQGGIRAAAMLHFELLPEAFVATSMATGLIVDLARMPVYFVSDWNAISAQWRVLVIAVLGVSIGTFLGVHVLSKLPRSIFKKMVSFLIFILGTTMLIKALRA